MIISFGTLTTALLLYASLINFASNNTPKIALNSPTYSADVIKLKNNKIALALRFAAYILTVTVLIYQSTL